jgi:hypothetical protein
LETLRVERDDKISWNKVMIGKIIGYRVIVRKRKMIIIANRSMVAKCDG